MSTCASASRGCARGEPCTLGTVTIAGGSSSLRAAASRGLVGRGVIAGAGADYGTVRTVSDHLDLSERAVERRVLRAVLDNVLAANVVRNLLANAVDVLQLLRVIGLPASRLGDRIQRASGALGFALLFLRKQTDRVDQHLALLR